MKAKIRYLKTGIVEIYPVVAVFFIKGRICLVKEPGFSMFYPLDEVEIEIHEN